MRVSRRLRRRSPRAALVGRAQVRQSQRLLRKLEAHPRPHVGPHRTDADGGRGAGATVTCVTVERKMAGYASLTRPTKHPSLQRIGVDELELLDALAFDLAG